MRKESAAGGKLPDCGKSYLAVLADAVKRAPEGARHLALYKAAASLGNSAHFACAVSPDMARATLLEAFNRATGGGRTAEGERTFADGFETGEANPGDFAAHEATYHGDRGAAKKARKAAARKVAVDATAEAVEAAGPAFFLDGKTGDYFRPDSPGINRPPRGVGYWLTKNYRQVNDKGDIQSNGAPYPVWRRCRSYRRSGGEGLRSLPGGRSVSGAGSGGARA